ncbi:MAG TPA: polysaccharide deacetylase family protein [Patescibacteria group bacterium]
MILTRKIDYSFVILSILAVPGFVFLQKNITPPSFKPQKILSVPDSRAVPNKKTLYLTLDADMNGSMQKRLQNKTVKAWYDPELIEYLKANNIKATFFVSGLFAEVYSNLIRDLNSTGNYTFENHSYDESGFTPYCYGLQTLKTDQEKIDQINKTQKILKDLTGRSPKYFRFPGICHGAHDDQLVQNLGLINNDGDVVASDPFNSNAQKIVQNIYRQVKDRGVIIMHVGGPNAPKSLEVLKQIIPHLQDQGYTFSSLQ